MSVTHEENVVEEVPELRERIYAKVPAHRLGGEGAGKYVRDFIRKERKHVRYISEMSDNVHLTVNFGIRTEEAKKKCGWGNSTTAERVYLLRVAKKAGGGEFAKEGFIASLDLNWLADEAELLHANGFQITHKSW